MEKCIPELLTILGAFFMTSVFYVLQLCAVQADKTMTQVIEELIDSLPNPEIVHSSNISSPVDLQSM
jgi:hypothetical protein